MVVWRMLFVGGGEGKLASVSEIGLSFFLWYVGLSWRKSSDSTNDIEASLNIPTP